MAYTYEFNASHGLVIIRNASSKWTGKDILKSAEEVIADEGFEPDYDWVYDLRFIRDTVVSVVEMEQIVERFRLFRDDGLVAPDRRSVFVGTDEDLRHTAALYQKRSSQPDGLMAVVETLEEARQWLGIDAPASEIGPTN